MRILTFAISNDGYVYSRLTVDGHTEGFAIPVLDFEGMNPANSFESIYDLNKFNSLTNGEWNTLKWTKKIPVTWKNVHRAFWGMKILLMNYHEKKFFGQLRKEIRIPGDPGYKKVEL